MLNLDLRDTQRAAIGLYEGLGYSALGHAPGLCPGRRRGSCRGHYYYKRLEDEPAAP